MLPSPRRRGDDVIDLERIRSGLLAQLGSDSKFSFVNTRLILKTGINLRDYKPQEARDPAVVAKVVGALAEQGFNSSGW
jgi:hypothetical protein